MKLHPLLERQLARLELDPSTPPDAAAWQRLLERVTQSYTESDQDRYLLERSLTISSREMQELYEQLREASETRIAEERDKLQAVVTALGDGLCVLGPEGELSYINPAGEDLLGWREAELRGKRVLEMLEVQDHGTGQLISGTTALDRVLETGQPHRNENGRFWRKDGTHFPTSYMLNPIINEGAFQGTVLVFRDTTEPKRVEEELNRRLSETLLLNRVIGAATSALDLNKVLEAICGALAEAFNLPQAAAALFDDTRSYLQVVAEYCEVGRPSALGAVIPVEGNEATQQVLRTRRPLIVMNAQTDPRQAVIHELERVRGTVSLLIVPLLVRDEVVGTIGLDSLEERGWTDEEVSLAQSVAAAASQALDNARLYQEVEQELAERKRAEAALVEAKEAAEQANRAKSIFLANVSHELRTPLNAIIGYSELLQEEAEDNGDDALTEDLSKIQEAGRQLLAIINDLLDISKIEAGQMMLDLQMFEVGYLLDSVLSTLEPLVERNNNRLVIEQDRNLGSMYADIGKVRQALLNLLSNATKFTRNGTITLTLRRETRQDGDWLHFGVSDTGIGIAPDKLAQLFQPFVQGDPSTTRKYGGTGLGLSITRSFCQMMGGDVAVWSELGKGSTFVIRLPARVRAPRPPQSAQSPLASPSVEV